MRLAGFLDTRHGRNTLDVADDEDEEAASAARVEEREGGGGWAAGLQQQVVGLGRALSCSAAGGSRKVVGAAPTAGAAFSAACSAACTTAGGTSHCDSFVALQYQ